MKIWIVDSDEIKAFHCAEDLEITFPAAFASYDEARTYREVVEADIVKLTGDKLFMLHLNSIELFFGGFAEALKHDLYQES